MGNSSSSPPYPPSYPSAASTTTTSSSYLPTSSPPPGSPATTTTKKCCFERSVPSTKDPYRGESFLCCCCYTCPASGRRTTSVFACIGVCFLVVTYTMIGALIFMALEGHIHPETAVAASKANSNSEHPLVSKLRSQTVDRLWSITENLNILYRENWTRLAAEEVLEFQKELVRNLRAGNMNGIDVYGTSTRDSTHEHRWSFSSSFLYSLTLITTIGYGSVAPRTSWGKLATILYALIGIPLMLVYLSTTGDVLARSFRKLYGKLCGTTPIKASGGDCPCSKSTVKVPITLCLILVFGYICGGAILFHRLENWSMLEGSYFCFTSLGTIGFGNLVPGQQHTEEMSLCICSVYILAGMALVAMCVSLVQEEASSLLRNISGSKCGTKPEPRAQEQEEISMSVVGS